MYEAKPPDAIGWAARSHPGWAVAIGDRMRSGHTRRGSIGRGADGYDSMIPPKSRHKITLDKVIYSTSCITKCTSDV